MVSAELAESYAAARVLSGPIFPETKLGDLGVVSGCIYVPSGCKNNLTDYK
jgi:hypothetical protein